MGAVEQCVEILNLTSFDWEINRKAVVAHSFRVMSKARNYDEMVVGIMHHVYASSSYSRALFGCDVTYSDRWKDSLNLFVRKTTAHHSKKEMSEVDLLNLNMDQTLKLEPGRIEEWMGKMCKWSSEYRRKLLRIGCDRTARNVMIYDLEDMLEILSRPVVDMGADINVVLPWKKEYVVQLRRGRLFYENVSIPDSDDKLLLRPLTQKENGDLVDKYTRALALLKGMADVDGPEDRDFTTSQRIAISDLCMRWYDSWLAHEAILDEMYGDEEDEQWEETI